MKNKSTIGLSMIVKNEENIIIDTLEKIIHVCDFFSISDTGSTDNTVSVITSYLEKHRQIMDISYIITQDKWVNFSHNRNISLDRLLNKVDYILLLDADDHFHMNTTFKQYLQPRKNVCFSITTKHINSKLENSKRRLIPAHLKWYYKYVVHEQLCCNDPYTTRKMTQNNYILHTRPTSNEKNNIYIKLMLDTLKKEPHVFNYRYHYIIHLMITKKYNDALKQIEYVKHNIIDLTNKQQLLIEYKHMMCLFRLNVDFDILHKQIMKLYDLEVVKKYNYDFLEPIYCGLIILVNRKMYEKAYEFGKDYYKKKILQNVHGFDYYKDLYIGLFDRYFERNVLSHITLQ